MIGRFIWRFGRALIITGFVAIWLGPALFHPRLWLSIIGAVTVVSLFTIFVFAKAEEAQERRR